MLYQGESCPVCKRQFEENDDVVFCPECGTPHHRECYGLVGHCVNRALHKTGYDYRKDHAPVIDAAKEAAKNNAPDGHADVFPPAGEDNNAFGAPVDFTRTYYDNDSATINGETVGDVAATVRSNAQRFVNVFKAQERTGRKTGWNWGAFIFGAYYLFYRKMYKQAITLFCINITISSLASLLTLKLAPRTTEALGELQTLMTGTDTSAVYEKFNAIQNLSDFNAFTMIMGGFFAITVIIRILLAVFADSIYKSHVTSFIKRVNEQFREGAVPDAPLLSDDDEVKFRLGQEQIKRIYLVRKGGVSVWAPFAAYMILTLINYITGAR